MIKAYFNEISKNYNVNYIEEDFPMGTLGSLSLLGNIFSDSIFVSNCDILVEIDYTLVMKMHKTRKNALTIISSMKEFIVPYGTIQANDEFEVHSIIEKPCFKYIVNTGLYILEPDLISLIPKTRACDFNELVEIAIKEGYKVGYYLIDESQWNDMGQIKEMENMIKKFKRNEV